MKYRAMDGKWTDSSETLMKVRELLIDLNLLYGEMGKEELEEIYRVLDLHRDSAWVHLKKVEKEIS